MLAMHAFKTIKVVDIMLIPPTTINHSEISINKNETPLLKVAVKFCPVFCS